MVTLIALILGIREIIILGLLWALMCVTMLFGYLFEKHRDNVAHYCGWV